VGVRCVSVPVSGVRSERSGVDWNSPTAPPNGGHPRQAPVIRLRPLQAHRPDLASGVRTLFRPTWDQASLGLDRGLGVSATRANATRVIE
jgi:hypothetical protein